MDNIHTIPSLILVAFLIKSPVELDPLVDVGHKYRSDLSTIGNMDLCNPTYYFELSKYSVTYESVGSIIRNPGYGIYFVYRFTSMEMLSC